jgi:hypothetical protein
MLPHLDLGMGDLKDVEKGSGKPREERRIS